MASCIIIKAEMLGAGESSQCKDGRARLQICRYHVHESGLEERLPVVTRFVTLIQE